MPEFGGFEIFLILCIALIVLGPKQLPQLARTLGLWIGRLRRSFNSFKQDIEREVGMDDVRRQLHNEQIMAEMKDLEDTSNTIHQEVESSFQIPSSKSPKSNDTLPDPLTKSN